uniref:C-type lectin domain-containing protein n=1 Tax=Acrobeloides nanus TaxID=290746 RepID=A0A914CYP9_9BILA
MVFIGTTLAACPDEWIKFSPSNKCYKHGGEYYEHTWDDTVNECRQLSAQLCSIHSEEENKFVRKIGSNPNWGNMWIGLKKTNGIWKWLDGTSLDYTNWNCNDKPCKDLNCAYMERETGKWDAASCVRNPSGQTPEERGAIPYPTTVCSLDDVDSEMSLF